MIRLLFQPIFPCDEAVVEDCNAYYDALANDVRSRSVKVTYAWLGVIATTMIGNMFLFYGFTIALERMNHRVRKAAF
jgi:hypothetical protein